MLKPKHLSFVLALIGIGAHVFMFWASDKIIATSGEQGAIFRGLYYLTIVPLIFSAMLIYSITVSKETSGNGKKKSAIIYLASALLGMSATLRAAYEIKEAKQLTGFNFNDNAKERLEQYKTDLFKGRLKKYKRSNEDTQ